MQPPERSRKQRTTFSWGYVLFPVLVSLLAVVVLAIDTLDKSHIPFWWRGRNGLTLWETLWDANVFWGELWFNLALIMVSTAFVLFKLGQGTCIGWKVSVQGERKATIVSGSVALGLLIAMGVTWTEPFPLGEPWYTTQYAYQVLAWPIPAGKEYKYLSPSGTINGIKILPSGEKYNWYIDGYLQKKEQAIAWYDEHGWLGEQPAGKAQASEYAAFQKSHGDKIYLVPQIGGVQLYESLWVIMGQARFGYYCRKDPEYIKRLVDDRKNAQLNILNELARYKPEAVFGGDDMGQKGRPLMSPEVFRTFFKPAYAEIFKKIHDMGAIAFNHSCGNITELLPDYIEAGLDGWQSLEPASNIDHAALKKKYGDRFLFVGGLDSREISFGTPGSIKRHVRDQVLKMGKGGGYIPGPTHDFLTETPLDNCIAMRDAVMSEGRYPLVP